MNEQDDVFDSDEDDNIENTYLNLGIAGEDYAINVGHVTEIVRLQKVFAVPDVQTHVRGVINLRGKVIPLLDVRTRFGLPFADYNDRTVVVVIELEGTPTGLVVDGVSGICEIPPDQVDPAPSTMRTSDHSLIRGLGKRGERVSFIIDVPTLVTTRGVTHHRKTEELRILPAQNHGQTANANGHSQFLGAARLERSRAGPRGRRTRCRRKADRRDCQRARRDDADLDRANQGRGP